jgi:hypothetical protein
MLDLQEGMDTFLGRVFHRGSLCLLFIRMHPFQKGCKLNTWRIFRFFPALWISSMPSASSLLALHGDITYTY